MDSTALREEKRHLAEQAAEWLYALEDADPDVLARFAEWIRESPAHAREFLIMSALDAEIGKIDPQRRLRVEDILANAARNVVPLGSCGATALECRRAGARTIARTGTWLGRAAVFVGVVCAAVFAWRLENSGQVYETNAGEQRSVMLADGSTIQLNMQSRVEVELTDTARDIRLLAGEAMFKVARDAHRPFRVRSGPSVIQAIGTQFNVNRRPSGTAVSVIEGRVQILSAASADAGSNGSAIDDRTAPERKPPRTDVRSPEQAVPATPPTALAQLAAGEQVRIDRDGRIERRAAIDPANMALWRQHRLVFRDDTLEDIAAEFSRYNPGTRIVLHGNVRSRRYTAVFDADDPQSLLQFLREERGLALENRGNVLIIRDEGTGTSGQRRVTVP